MTEQLPNDPGAHAEQSAHIQALRDASQALDATLRMLVERLAGSLTPAEVAQLGLVVVVHALVKVHGVPETVRQLHELADDLPAAALPTVGIGELMEPATHSQPDRALPERRAVKDALRSAGLSSRQADALLRDGWRCLVGESAAEAAETKQALDDLRASLVRTDISG